jgi:hypothetical protein
VGCELRRRLKAGKGAKDGKKEKAIEERVQTLVAEMLAEEEGEGQLNNINDIKDAMVRIGDLVAREARMRTGEWCISWSSQAEGLLGFGSWWRLLVFELLVEPG